MRGRVRVGHSKVDAVGEEKRAGAGIVKFVAVVALNCLDRVAELSFHIREKVRQRRESVRFEPQGKRPKIV